MSNDWVQRMAEREAKAEREPVELIPAATVILVRDHPEHEGSIEVLMVRRSSKLSFAGGHWVFPGGRVDPDDRVSASGGAADELASARRAAVREAAEESGLVIDEGGLVTFSHWTPPPISPKRFSTWFFLARAPDGDITVDGGEILDHAWLEPDEVLRRRDRLAIELSPPTWITLHHLRGFASVDEALAHAVSTEPEAYATRISTDDGAVVALYHGDAGYEDGDAALPGARHRLVMRDTTWSYERSGPS